MIDRDDYCEWRKIEKEYYGDIVTDYYDTSCGAKINILFKSNGFKPTKFCPCCGKPIKKL